MKYLIVILTMFTYSAMAQSSEEGVKKVINSFFDGMRESDTAKMWAALAPSVMLQTITKTKEGKTSVLTVDAVNFLAFVAKPHDAPYDERIQYDMIKIEGELASVWMPYTFYVGDKFSHCGTNSFQLVRYDGGWKIQYIIDTRYKDDCK